MAREQSNLKTPQLELHQQFNVDEGDVNESSLLDSRSSTINNSGALTEENVNGGENIISHAADNVLIVPENDGINGQVGDTVDDVGNRDAVAQSSICETRELKETDGARTGINFHDGTENQTNDANEIKQEDSTKDELKTQMEHNEFDCDSSVTKVNNDEIHILDIDDILFSIAEFCNVRDYVLLGKAFERLNKLTMMNDGSNKYSKRINEYWKRQCETICCDFELTNFKCQNWCIMYGELHEILANNMYFTVLGKRQANFRDPHKVKQKYHKFLMTAPHDNDDNDDNKNQNHDVDALITELPIKLDLCKNCTWQTIISEDYINLFKFYNLDGGDNCKLIDNCELPSWPSRRSQTVFGRVCFYGSVKIFNHFFKIIDEKQCRNESEIEYQCKQVCDGLREASHRQTVIVQKLVKFIMTKLSHDNNDNQVYRRYIDAKSVLHLALEHLSCSKDGSFNLKSKLSNNNQIATLLIDGIGDTLLDTLVTVEWFKRLRFCNFKKQQKQQKKTTQRQKTKQQRQLKRKTNKN